MNEWLKKGRRCVLMAVVCMVLFAAGALASEDDNSLSSLGISTEGVTVSPEFAYNIWSYEVVVPGGTKELSLDPVPSSASASISSVNGTTLKEDGTGYVTITVQAGNGSQFTYELNVTSDGTVPAAETEAQTEPQTEKETETEAEPETEDSQYVKVDKNSLQEAENTITNLKGQITEYKEKVSLFTKVMYGLIGLAVILLFAVINLLLKKKDLKAELNDYRSYGYTDSKKAKKAEKKQEKAEKKQKEASGMQETFQEQPLYQELEIPPQMARKAKQMPQYEQPVKPQKYEQAKMQAPSYEHQSQPVKTAVQPSTQTGKKGRKADVEINMIDL